MSSQEKHCIVIVGGGISGLATALALHSVLCLCSSLSLFMMSTPRFLLIFRKGLRSLVLERSETLRAAGLAIGVYSNGWRALDQLGVGDKLRRKAIRISRIEDPNFGVGGQHEILLGKEELRCLKRSDLIETLAHDLPPSSIRFGCRVIAIGEEPGSSFPIIHLQDGSVIIAKVLIGCDGVNSAVARWLGLQDPKFFYLSALRGFTYFSESHGLGNTFHRSRRNSNIFGMIPIDEKLVHWFIAWPTSPLRDEERTSNPELIKKVALTLAEDFPESYKDMVEKSDASSLIITPIPYRAPWALLTCKPFRGTVTVAGDAMHAMGPFLGQGGASGLEDAVVLARSLSKEMHVDCENDFGDEELKARVGRSLDQYAKQRKVRVLLLSVQTFLIGTMLQSSSKIVKLAIFLILGVAFWGNYLRHVQYDCGRL